MKAVALFSGGLDSALAIKLVQKQGIQIVAVYFHSPFFEPESTKRIKHLARILNIKLKVIELGSDYVRLVRHPNHGYGKNINPCVDCHMYMLKSAEKYAKKIGARFISTGEVVGQRPMSQHKHTLLMIGKRTGLSGKILRPLSAKLLPETEAERKGWVDRSKLLEIEGRRRGIQLKLAKKLNISGFQSGGSGCKLTDMGYANKVGDLFKNKKRITIRDVELLNFGRHFRYNKNKIIVGRNEQDNKMLMRLKLKSDLAFEVEDIAGPTTVLKGKLTKKSIQLAAKLTARYSDAESKTVVVLYGNQRLNKEIIVNPAKEKEIESLRI